MDRNHQIHLHLNPFVVMPFHRLTSTELAEDCLQDETFAIATSGYIFTVVAYSDGHTEVTSMDDFPDQELAKPIADQAKREAKELLQAKAYAKNVLDDDIRQASESQTGWPCHKLDWWI